MSRGSRGYTSSRGSSYRGSGRGSWHSSSRGYNSSGRGRGGYNSSHNSFHSNSYDRRYSGSSDKYSGSRRDHTDEYRKPYKTNWSSHQESSGYREHRSPERKRLRTESSHERSFGGSAPEYKSRYETERRSFSNDRRASSYTRKEEFRKPPPPSSSPRGGYRGRISSSRGGALRARLRERPIRRRLVETSYTVRRRLPVRTSDYIRRLKINKLRSTIARRARKSMSDAESDNEEGDKASKDEQPVEETSDKDNIQIKEEKMTPKKVQQSPNAEKEEETSDKDEKKAIEDDVERKSTYIKLVCPHCTTYCTTFAKYKMHLQSGRHAASMRRVATKQKALLSQMRLIQRKAQRELEKSTDDLAPRTSWCPMCKLNYKQPKVTHQASAAHLEMKRFLMPFCKTCKITFKSPMIYESHCCSIDHIKRKAEQKNNAAEKEELPAGDEALENFMTIDSIGDVDEEGDANIKDGEKPKENVNVGIERIKKMEVYYCDLCRMYLPQLHDDDEMNKELIRHCKQRTHLQMYIRYKEDKELVKKAERLVRKENAEKEKEKHEKSAADPAGEAGSKDENKSEEAMIEDDKFYELTITNDTGKTDAEDEDDEEDSVVNGERYDRFRQSEKNAEGKKEGGAIVGEEEEEEKAAVVAEEVKN